MAEEKKTNAANTPDSETKPKKKASSKADEIAKLKKELELKNEQLLRTAAEFDNFKRRTEKERVSAAEFNSASLLKKLLPIFDNVDRANMVDKNSPDYAKGVELTVKMLTDVVHELGLKEIGVVGDTFDPRFHEAVMHIDDENLGENVIAQVLQKGYMIGETVIRPAMVQVAN